MAKKIDLSKIAYVRHPVLPAVKHRLNDEGFKIIDAAFAPANANILDGTGQASAEPPALRDDGPTVAEYVERGYLAVNYPPAGYASRSTPEEIAAAIAAQQAPAGGGTDGSGAPASETPDGTPTPIPDDWETMHHTKQISLAKALAGDFTAPEGQTMTEKAKSIILAAVTDRANPPAKPE